MLDAALRHEVAAFSNDLRRAGAVGSGALAGPGDCGVRAGQVIMTSRISTLKQNLVSTS